MWQASTLKESKYGALSLGRSKSLKVKFGHNKAKNLNFLK